MVKAKCWLLGVVIAGLVAGCDNSDTHLSVARAAETPPPFVLQQGDEFFVEHGAIRLGLKPLIGGRVASLKYAGHELMKTQDPGKKVLWGGVFWTSPQSVWSWPPIEAHDSKAYRVSIESDALVFTSRPDAKTGFKIAKRFSVIPGSESLRFQYRIYNHSQETKQVAPWEITRFKAGGLTLYPKGEDGYESGIFYLLPVKELNGIVWQRYDMENLPKDHHKLMSDGSEGWLAYVNEGYLVVKQFEDIPAARTAPGEGEIELFANAERTSMELQQQGPLTTLKAGEYLEWQVIWHVQKVPQGLSVEEGSQELVDYIRDLVARHQSDQATPES